MADECLERVRKVTELKGYSYRIWEYQASLSTLVLRARHPDKPKHNIHLIFQGVVYLQMPIHWEVGDFRLGSEDQRIEMARQMGYDNLDPDQFWMAGTPEMPVYVVARIAAILENVEPMY